MSRGTVKFYDRMKKFGFIYGDGVDIFFHLNDVRYRSTRLPVPGTVVDYSLYVDSNGRHYARDITILSSPNGNELVALRADGSSLQLSDRKIQILDRKLHGLLVAESQKKQEP